MFRALTPHSLDGGQRGEAQQKDDGHQDGQGRDLDVKGLDLFPQVFRGAAHHEAGQEDGQHHEDQHAEEAGADAAEDDLAQMDVEHGHQPAQGREGVVHGVDRAAGGVRGHRGKEGGIKDAETDFLAFHVAVAAGRPPRPSAAGCQRIPPPSRPARPTRNSRNMAAHTDQPCFWF